MGVEGIGNDIVGTELAFGNHVCDGFRGGYLHFVVDVACAHVERSAEDTGECKHVVYLVGEVAPARAHYLDARFKSFVGHDFGNGVRHCEHDGIGVHGLNHFLGQTAGSGNADKHVCALDDVRKAALLHFQVGYFRHFRLDGVKAVPALVDCALTVAQHDVLQALAHQKFGDCNTCRARAVYNYGEVFQLLARKFESVEHSRHGNHRGAVLVVVEYGNIAHFLQPLFYFKATGSGDVFQIDTAEAAGKQRHGLDDIVNVLGADAQGESVNVAEGLEQRALTFHNGHTCLGTYVAQTQNGGAVGDYRHQIRPAGISVGKVYVLGNFQARLCNAGSIRHGKLFTVGDGCAGNNFYLARPFAVLFKRILLFIHFISPL